MSVKCDLCGGDVLILTSQDIRLIPAWCMQCGCYSDGKRWHHPTGTKALINDAVNQLRLTIANSMLELAKKGRIDEAEFLAWAHRIMGETA